MAAHGGLTDMAMEPNWMTHGKQWIDECCEEFFKYRPLTPEQRKALEDQFKDRPKMREAIANLARGKCR